MIVKYSVVFQEVDATNPMYGIRTFERYDTLENALNRAKVLAEEHTNVYVSEEYYANEKRLFRGSFFESLVKWANTGDTDDMPYPKK